MEDINKKKLIINSIIIIAIVFLCLIVYLVFNKENNSKYLMVGDYLLWQQINGKWEQLTSIPEKFIDNKFTLYHDNTKNEDVIVQNSNNKWYYFDKNYNQLNYENFRGLTLNIDVEFPNYQIEIADQNDEKYINEIKTHFITNTVGNYYTYKVNLDFDNDGKKETLYTTTNYTFDIVNYKFNSAFYMVKNGKIEQIIEKSEMPYNFISVLNIDEDKNYEIIMGYDIKNMPALNSCYKLYKLENNKWVNKKNCQQSK